MPDWQAIRADYEAGVSKSTLAKLHDISRQAIIKRARSEHWITPLVTSPSHVVTSPVTNDETDNQPTVEKAIALIAQRLDEKPENKDIKMLMDSLSQAYKIKMLLPQEEQESADSVRELLQYCTDEEISIIKPVLAAATARKQSEQEKIHPIRRIG